MTVGDYAAGVPRIRVGEFFRLLMRQLLWFIPLLVLGGFASFYFTKDMKRQYTADGTIMVQLGSEYVYNPVGERTNQGAGLQITPDHIVLNEIAIFKKTSAMEAVSYTHLTLPTILLV